MPEKARLSSFALSEYPSRLTVDGFGLEYVQASSGLPGRRLAACLLDDAIPEMGVPVEAREAFLTQLARGRLPSLHYWERIRALLEQRPRRN